MKMNPGKFILAFTMLHNAIAFQNPTLTQIQFQTQTDPLTQLNMQPSNRRTFIKTSILSSTLAITQSSVPAYADADADGIQVGGKIHYGDEKIMSPKDHGTTMTPVQETLRYDVSRKTADKICSYNRRFAEYSTYFQEQPQFISALKDSAQQNNAPITFYDSVTGKPLFRAPIGRTTQEFYEESQYHGWPSFRDEEVVWENVRVLKNSGETVSVSGTHLGHNIPDKKGNRYCINLVSISGNPV